MKPTAAQHRRALELIRDRDRLVAEIAQLKRLITDMQTVIRTHDFLRWDRVCFNLDPNLFAGLLDTYRRTDPETRRQIDVRYTQMMKDMHPATNPLPGAPRTPDYAALIPAARPFLLPAFLDLSFGNAYPRLCFARTDLHSGLLTYVSAKGPSNPEAWRSQLPAISEWLGGDWELVHHTVNAATLQQRTPLPKSFSFDRRTLMRGQLYLGIDVATRQPVYVPFAEMPSGTFIPGATGTGKSNALHVLLASIFANLPHFAAVYLVDGKDGVTMNRYRHIAPEKVHVLWEEKHLWKLTTELVAFMRARNAAQRDRNIDNATDQFIAVVIDEMSTYTAKPSSDGKNPDNKLHARFIDELAMLARRGRSTGLRLFIAAQEPNDDQIPTSVRANCTSTISFRLPIDAHAISVFGRLEGLPADPRRLERGRALFRNGLSGSLQHVQFPVGGGV